MEDKFDTKNAQSSCVNCRERKRKCTGRNPCANCIKFKQNCSYHSTSDRRRRKYHTDYVDFLEVKVNTIEKFIKEFIQNDPELNQVMSERLKNLSKFDQSEEDVFQMNLPKAKQASSHRDGYVDDTGHDEFIDDLLTATEELRINDDEPQFNTIMPQYTSELQDLLQNDSNIISSTSTPVSMIGTNLVFRDTQYEKTLIELFDKNFAIHSMALKYMIPIIKSSSYNYSMNPTLHLFLTTVYGIASIYSSHRDKKVHETYFIASARDTLMSITCKCKVDIYIVLNLYLLSCYEMGQGNLHQSYMMNSMACSITQHLGLHISYDDHDLQNSHYAPKSSPLNSAILWSVCLQDRLITSMIQVPCVIHFKRIISSFYNIQTNKGMESHVTELCFAYMTRLWYIYDRYTDQIFSVNFDIGDTNDREKVLVMALKTLKELMGSLPLQLRLSSLNLKIQHDTNDENLFIILFNFNYHVCVLQLNKIFVKDLPHATRKALVEEAIKASNIISILVKNQEIFSFDRLPFYLENSIHSVALVLLFILTAGHSKYLYKLKLDTNVLELYQNCVQLLEILSTNWPSSSFRLKHLLSLADKYNLDKNIQTPSSSGSVESPLSRSIQIALEDINADVFDETFLSPPPMLPPQAFNAPGRTLEEINSFQLFDTQFPMYGLNPQTQDFSQQLKELQPQPQPTLSPPPQQIPQQQYTPPQRPNQQQYTPPQKPIQRLSIPQYSQQFQQNIDSQIPQFYDQYPPQQPQQPHQLQPQSQALQFQQEYPQQYNPHFAPTFQQYSSPPQDSTTQRQYTNSSSDIAPLTEDFF